MQNLTELRDRIVALEQQLAQSERFRLEGLRYRRIFETLPIGVTITRDSDGSFAEFNDAAARSLGYTREEFAALTAHDLELPLFSPDILHAATPAVFETKLKTSSGELRDVVIATHPIKIEGELVACGILQDITERKRAEEALEKQLSITQAITATAADAVFMADAERRVTFANPAAERMFGFSLEELRGKRMHALVHHTRPNGAPYPASECPLGEVFRSGATLTDHRDIFFRKDGAPIHVSISNAPLVKEGRIIATVVIVRDATERERGERELRETNERLAAALATADLGLWNVNFATGDLSWDGRMKALFGLAPQTVITRERAVAFIHPDDRAYADSILLRLPGIEGEIQWEWRVILDNGETHWQHSRGHFVCDSSGKVVRGRGVTRDITDQKLAQEVRERFAAIVEGTEDAITSTTPDGIVTSWNRGAERIYGYSAAEMIGDSPARLIPPERAGELRRFLRIIARGESIDRYQTECVTRDGKRILVSLTLSPMRNREGQIFGVSLITRDITREKHLEEKLRQTEKMDAIGQLAGGIAHDFNNLLTVINGYASLALMDDFREMVPEYLREIGAAGERATILTRQLLAFSRKQMLQMRVLNVNAVVDSMRPLLARVIREDIECTTVLDPGGTSVVADRNQLEQVVLNLVVNASDAMPAGGKIVIETKNVLLDAQHAREYPEVVPGSFVMLAVSDTGWGIEPAVLSRIFDPFFTTKPVGKGTGLGLSSVYGIVKQSGGHVTCYSEVGAGTTFRVYLPASLVQATENQKEDHPEVESVRGTESILLVEDDPALRGYAVNVLQDRGYTVHAAADGKEALLLAKRNEYKINLLITDVVMPRMSGRELAQTLAPLTPGLRVLYVSGYTENAIVQKGVLEPGLEFLSKPFNPAQLTKRIREVLSVPLRAGSVVLAGAESDELACLSASLGRAGYDVSTTADAVGALLVCHNKPVDLLVLDVDSADTESLEVIRCCRREVPNTWLLVLSGSDDASFLQAAAKSGVRSILQKPVAFESLARIVRGLIG